jgi:hypothetical protein
VADTQNGGSLCGSAKTEITVRDGLHSRLRPQLAEFAATECPPGAHGEGPAGPATLDPVGGMSARLPARLRVSFPERHAIHLNPDHPSIHNDLAALINECPSITALPGRE